MIAVIGLSMALSVPALAAGGDGPCTGRWETVNQNERGIRCVFKRWNNDYGNVAKALDVAWCESRYNEDAYGNGNAGLFQHRLVYWPDRFERYIERNRLRRTWGLSSSPYSGRTNAIVTALYVRAHGWSAWSCA